MARCCAVILGEGISGNLIFHQVMKFILFSLAIISELTDFSVCQAQEEAPTSIDGTIKGLKPVSVCQMSS